MIILGVILFLIYVVYFRADGGSVQSALKILKGLNSNTFNYLEANKDMLRVSLNIPSFDADESKTLTLSPTVFFSQCVRINKPCKLTGMANSWTAT